MDITKEYIAGFFDGEGSIGIYSRKDRFNGTCCRIQVVQNKTEDSTPLFNFLKNKYGGNISEQITLSNGIKYNWQLNPKGTKAFLLDILPYLKLKRKQALLALYWIDNRPKAKRSKSGTIEKFTDQEIKSTQKIIKLLKLLKINDINMIPIEYHDLLAVVKG